jgi:glycerol-3-phosphate cytidylyltransferase
MNEKVIYTGGTFDLSHAGHVAFLKKCSELGNVIVAVNTDEFVLEFKKKKPICSLSERIAVLRSCKYVSSVVVNIGDDDSKLTILLVKPDYIVIGSDWASKDYYKQMNFTKQWLDEQGIALIYIPYTEGISTTSIKNRMNTK